MECENERSGLEPGLKLSLAPSFESPASQHAIAPFKLITGGSGTGTIIVIINYHCDPKTS